MGSSVILPPQGQPIEGPDPNFKQGSITNLVQFRFQHVDPPAGFYIQRDDLLLLQVVSQVPNELVAISFRCLLPYAQAAGQPDAHPDGAVPGGPVVGPGYIQTFQKIVGPVTALTPVQLSVPLLEGYLLSVGAVGALATVVGQTFVRVQLIRGSPSSVAGNQYQLLLSGYVTGLQSLGWPGGQLVRPSDGQGFLTSYTVANPGAGADFSFTTNAVGRARLADVVATLTTSATAGNRFPSFAISESTLGTVQYQVQEPTAVPASTTITYSLAPGGTNVRGGGAPIFETLPVPAPFLGRSGLTVASSTAGILAGDQWSAIRIYTEEWLDVLL